MPICLSRFEFQSVLLLFLAILFNNQSSCFNFVHNQLTMKDFKAGVHVRTLHGYTAFKPRPINRSYHFDNPELQMLTDQANLKLGELNAFDGLVPNLDHFIRLHIFKEATVSSKIEGTQTPLGEALQEEKNVAPERRDDWREVNNYVVAMNQAIERLPQLPLSSRMLKDAHATLLRGVRGEHKLPGEFRISQNWIGGATLRDATFIPPEHEDAKQLMFDLEQFLHSDESNLPHVVKAALAHYQFETIHPFLDGNGRIGRLMITLYFIHAGILRLPLLYLSDFFERNRTAYYDNLMRVRTHNDLRQWVRFFLVGVVETATKANSGLRGILQLKNDCLRDRIPQLGRNSITAHKLLDRLFQQPYMNAEDVAEAIDQTPPQAYKLITDFERLNILKEITGNKRGRIYRFEEYFRIFEQ
jgi:Fic family protein